jgi:hypothetical protein
MSPHRASLSLLVCLLIVSVGAAVPPAEPVAAGAREDGRPADTDLYGDPLPPVAVARLGTVRWRYSAMGAGDSRELAFSPDGKTVAVGGPCIVDLATGKQVDWFPVNPRIAAAAFSADGKTLITAARDESGQLLPSASMVRWAGTSWSSRPTATFSWPTTKRST